jgi:hypothetical protein
MVLKRISVLMAVLCAVCFYFPACDGGSGSDTGDVPAVTDGQSWDKLGSYYVNNPLADKNYWVRAYGSGQNEYGTVVRIATNGDYLVAGYKFSVKVENSHALWLLRLSPNGKVVWCRSFGPVTNSQTPCDMAATPDNGCMITGNAIGGVVFIKVDATGAIAWQKKLAGLFNSSIAEIPGTGFAAVVNDWIHILNYQGAIVRSWRLMIDATHGYPQDRIMVTPDGGLLVSTAGIFSRISPDGTLEWSKRETSDNWLHIEHVIPSSAGGYLLTGATEGYNYGEGDTDLVLVKVDAQGNFVWAKKYAQTAAALLGRCENNGLRITETGSGEIVVMGKSSVSGAWGIMGGDDIQFPIFLTGGIVDHTWLLKTDASGNTVWHRSIRDQMSVVFFLGPMMLNTINSVDMVQTDDGFLLAGDIGLYVDMSNVHRITKGLVVKTDAVGEIPNTWCVTGNVSSVPESLDLQFGDTGVFLMDASAGLIDGDLVATELAAKYISL